MAYISQEFRFGKLRISGSLQHLPELLLIELFGTNRFIHIPCINHNTVRFLGRNDNRLHPLVFRRPLPSLINAGITDLHTLPDSAHMSQRGKSSDLFLIFRINGLQKRIPEFIPVIGFKRYCPFFTLIPDKDAFRRAVINFYDSLENVVQHFQRHIH